MLDDRILQLEQELNTSKKLIVTLENELTKYRDADKNTLNIQNSKDALFIQEAINEENLEASEILKTLLNTTNDGFWIVDICRVDRDVCHPSDKHK